MSSTLDFPVARFLHTLEIVAKEGKHLSYSWNNLFSHPARLVEDLALAKEYSLMLIETFNRLRQDVMTRMGLKKKGLPEELPLLWLAAK